MIKEDAFGTIWVMTLGIPYKVQGDELIPVKIERDESLVQKALADNRGIWFAEEYLILKTYEDKVVEIKDLSTILDQKISNFVEFPENSGEYFVGTNAGGVWHYKDGGFTHYSTPDGLQSRYIWKLYVDRGQHVIVISFAGLSIWNGSDFTPLDLQYSNSSLQVNSILQDRDGSYWVGTNRDGLLNLRTPHISMIGPDEGLKNDRMLSLTTLNSGEYLFATNCGGVYTYNPDTNKVDQPPISPLLPNQCIWSVFQDSKNRMWFGSRILHRSSSLSELGVTFSKQDGFDGVEVFTISEDSNGFIWIGTLNGLFKYDGRSFRKFSVSDGLSFNDTRAVYEDREGVIWVGTTRGLNRIKHDSVETVSLLDSNSSDAENFEPYVRYIHQDEDGVLWIGTYGNGIFRIKQNRVSNIRQADGLFDDIVSHIIEDERGYFWMGSNRGISRVSKADLNAVIAGEIDVVRAYAYGTADGMEFAETNGGFQPSAFIDSFGKIYFPTVGGVAVVSTKEVAGNDVVPPVYIEHLRTNEAELPLTGRLSLSYNTPYLQIQYTALDFSDPKKIQFKHRIKGLNEDWIDVGYNREAIYSRIPPGEYTFQVIARNSDGVWNYEGASLAISVIPPFWQTSWFYVLMAALFLSSGPAVYYVRVRNLKNESRRQKRYAEKLVESQESERRRIASELHDGLGQQILVIKNRAELARSQVDDKKALSLQLYEIMQSALSSIEDVRAISHNLRPVHLEKFGLTEALEDLFEKLQLTSSIEWSCQIENIDNLIPKDKEINFYRVIQEGCNNISKHSGASEALIVIKRFENHFKTFLSDDGRGFDTTNLDDVSGLGLLGMKERVQSLGGALIIDSDTESGTALTITIPINRTDE
ncbi:MAG: two-component regulator propeller domain-containing protein [Cyclonatronaceae bacterium]